MCTFLAFLENLNCFPYVVLLRITRAGLNESEAPGKVVTARPLHAERNPFSHALV